MVAGARQSFQFFRKITWFLGNNRALSKFRYQILHYLISIINFEKNQSIKPNFISSTQSTLKSVSRYVFATQEHCSDFDFIHYIKRDLLYPIVSLINLLMDSCRCFSLGKSIYRRCNSLCNNCLWPQIVLG